MVRDKAINTMPVAMAAIVCSIILRPLAAVAADPTMPEPIQVVRVVEPVATIGAAMVA